MKLAKVLFILLAIVLLAGLFFFFKPNPQQQSIQTPHRQTQSTATPVEKIKTFKLVFKGKKLVVGKPTINVKKDDDVVLKITSDEAEELHIHGYDVFTDLKKDKEATLSFKARVTGRFPYELEYSGTEIGAVEVMPK